MADFTPHQLQTWLAVLSVFDVKIVNRAVLEFGLAEDPFPDIGKIFLKCQRIKFSQSGQYAASRDDSKPTESSIEAAAKALKLDI
jgi:hypothetical protein